MVSPVYMTLDHWENHCIGMTIKCIYVAIYIFKMVSTYAVFWEYIKAYKKYIVHMLPGIGLCSYQEPFTNT